MTISTKGPKSDSGRSAGAQGRDQGAKPVSGVFRTLYKWWKYSTIIGVALTIVLGGMLLLGDVGEHVEGDKKLTALYQASDIYSQATQGINKLFNSKKSSFISNRAVNLYLQEKVNKNDNHEELNKQFADVEHFADYFLTQRYQNQHVVKFPLSMYERNFVQVVDEPATSKALRWFKTKVETFLQKNELAMDNNVKELKWSRVKKLVDSAKFEQMIELLKGNTINWAWSWIGSPAKVTILLMDESSISKSTPAIIEKNKKLLKKWIQKNEENSEIIILSRYSINSLYDESKQDVFKSYQVQTGLDKFDKSSLCKYLGEQAQLNEAQCSVMRDNFDSIDELERFVEKSDSEEPNMFKLSQNQDQLEKVLQKVCDKGHVKYYFYENQQNANNVLQRNKKAKKSRLDRQMDALLVKFSQLKHFLGINRIKDVYNTLTTGQTENKENTLTLSELNSMGLLYDFQTHELRWKNNQKRIGYQIKVQRSCKGEKHVQAQINEQEEKAKKKEKTQKQQEQEQQQLVEEDEVNEEEDVEEQYEDNPIDYRHTDEQEETEKIQEQTEEQLVEEQEQDQQLNEQDEKDYSAVSQQEQVQQGTGQQQEEQEERTQGQQAEQEQQKEAVEVEQQNQQLLPESQDQQEKTAQQQEEANDQEQQEGSQISQEQTGQQTAEQQQKENNQDKQQAPEREEQTQDQQQQRNGEQENNPLDQQNQQHENMQTQQQQQTKQTQFLDNPATQSQQNPETQKKQGEKQQQQQQNSLQAQQEEKTQQQQAEQTEKQDPVEQQQQTQTAQDYQEQQEEQQSQNHNQTGQNQNTQQQQSQENSESNHQQAQIQDQEGTNENQQQKAKIQSQSPSTQTQTNISENSHTQTTQETEQNQDNSSHQQPQDTPQAQPITTN